MIVKKRRKDGVVQRYHESVLVFSNKMVKLVRDGEVLASVKLNHNSDTAVNISDWKAKKKGKGYGKELLVKFFGSKPDLFFITTDGFTEAGLVNIKNVLPNWKVVTLRRGYAASVAVLMRQDAIDYYIDNRGGRFGFYYLDKSLHSKYKGGFMSNLPVKKPRVRMIS